MMSDDVQWDAEDFIPLEDADLGDLNEKLGIVNRLLWEEACLTTQLEEARQKALTAGGTETGSKLASLACLRDGASRRTNILALLGTRLATLTDEKKKEEKKP